MNIDLEKLQKFIEDLHKDVVTSDCVTSDATIYVGEDNYGRRLEINIIATTEPEKLFNDDPKEDWICVTK